MNFCYLKTIEGWYVHEIRGACYVSWVSEKDKDEALKFPLEGSGLWMELLSTWTGKSLLYEQIHE